MERVLCLAIGYVFGLFQTSYIYGKMYGIDIREHGSGNAGTTNMLRTLGAKAGVITLLGDAFKCVFAVLFMKLLLGSTYPDILPLLSFYTAAGVILGHNFPFYLGFKGGKGIAATAGLILTLGWQITCLELLIFVLTVLLTRYVSLGSLLVYTGLMAELVIFGQRGFFGMTPAHLYEMYGVGAALTILAFWRHRENIRRLLKGEERKFHLKK